MKVTDATLLASTLGIPLCSILVGVVWAFAGPFPAFLMGGASFWLGMMVNQLITNHYQSKEL